ncbi:MAG: exonuclease SbcC, partial [Rhodobacteraceae bacterium]|nr:exonuclease SbcC [Paracoccaceae bacterium]
ETFEASERARDTAQDQARDTAGLLSSGEAILDDRNMQLDALAKPQRDRAVWHSLLAAANVAKTELENDQRFADLQQRLAKVEATFAAAEKDRTEAAQDVARQSEASSNAQTALETTLSEIPTKWQNGTVLAEAHATAKAVQERLELSHTAAVAAEKTAALVFASAQEALRHATAALARVQSAAQAAEASFSQRLEQSKLSEDGYALAKADIADLRDLEATIQSHNNKIASNSDHLTRLAAEIGGRIHPDLEALKTAAQTCQTKLEEAQKLQSRLITELARKSHVLDLVAKLSAQISKLEAEFAPLGEVSKLVNGENDLKVRLPDFAIAAMFDEVLSAANLRLGPMTNQRYQLHRPVETTGGRTKRGLDIAVFDANTEKSRSTTSLSGGEGFQASLALALGLSDVVQQNSGGIKLDAIFIDEGFGTLDQETLDTALDTLCALAGERRAVGLISHTEQVKNLITEGFDIEVTPSGSHIHARTSARSLFSPQLFG